MSINGTPPSGGGQHAVGPLAKPPVAERARQGTKVRARQAWQNSLAHVQRGMRRLMEHLRTEMAADGRKVSIEAGLKGDPVIRVTDKNTGEVIREIPPEVTRRIAAKLEMLRGVFIDRKG